MNKEVCYQLLNCTRGVIGLLHDFEKVNYFTTDYQFNGTYHIRVYGTDENNKTICIHYHTKDKLLYDYTVSLLNTMMKYANKFFKRFNI